LSRWFRVYDDLIDDPKVQQLDPETFKFLVNCWCIASKLGGNLPDVNQIAFQTRMRADKVSRLLNDLRARQLIDDTDQGLEPHNWKGRQYKSDVSTERVRRFRERHGNANETFQKRPQSTETDNRTERTPIVPKGDDDLFPEFWDAYAKKVQRPLAERSYLKALKKTGHETIVAAAKLWRDAVEEQFRPYPSKWLNQEMWNDPPPVQSERRMNNAERNGTALRTTYEKYFGQGRPAIGLPNKGGGGGYGIDHALGLPPPRRGEP
jgi:hypothetical protein